MPRKVKWFSFLMNVRSIGVHRLSRIIWAAVIAAMTVLCLNPLVQGQELSYSFAHERLTLTNLARRPARLLKSAFKIGHLDFVIDAT
jgi:hypothetical protein